MRRLISLLLLIIAPLATMAQTNYPIHDDFRAEFDCLRDEGKEFTTLLQGAGVAASLIQTRGTMHGFDMSQRSEITQHQIVERCMWLNEW